jgi:hypothetical protein
MRGQLLQAATLTRRTTRAFDRRLTRHSTKRLLHRSPRCRLPQNLPRLLEELRINLDSSAFGHDHMKTKAR